MKTSSFVKILIPAAAAFVACQTGFAQQVAPHALVPAGAVAPHTARPHIWVTGRTASVAAPTTNASPNFTLPSICTAGGHYFEFCPNNFQTIYGVNSIVSGNGGAGMTIGIVDAYHYAAVDADFATFNANFGTPACTVASGCLTIQHCTGTSGSAPYTYSCRLPLGSDAADTGWELETMLDVEYAHAMAPNAKILLVEANTPGNSDMYGAENFAADSGVTVISNSWGEGEFGGDPSDNVTFQHNIPIFASSGDNGAAPGASFPCSSPNVTCVGGTSLTVNANFARTLESAWAGSGGGCSTQFGLPGYQNIGALAGGGAPTICSANAPVRAVPDVAMDADPNTGAWVYDVGNCGVGFVCGVGGTSLASPLTAGLFATISTARHAFGQAPFNYLNVPIYAGVVNKYAYFFYDVTSGNNGFPATAGYDLVTGLGVPLGPQMGNRFFGLVWTGR